MNILRMFATTVFVVTALSACQSTSEPQNIMNENNKELVQDSQTTMLAYEKVKKDYTVWLDRVEASKEMRIYGKNKVKKLVEAWDKTVDVYQDFALHPEKATQVYSVFSSGSYAEIFNNRLSDVVKLHTELLTLKQTADTLLADAIVEMSYLNDIDAPTVFPSRYKLIERNYHKLYVYIAEKGVNHVQLEQAIFLKKVKALEIAVGLKLNITPLSEQIALLRKEGFKSIVPISYTKTMVMLDKAELVVTLNPRDSLAIESAVDIVNFEILHLKHIGLEVKRFINVENSKFEPLVLELESGLHNISEALDNQDLRNSPMQYRIDILTDKAAELTATLNEEYDVAPQLVELMDKVKKLDTEPMVSETEIRTMLDQVTDLGSINESVIDDIRMERDAIVLNQIAESKVELEVTGLSDIQATTTAKESDVSEILMSEISDIETVADVVPEA